MTLSQRLAIGLGALLVVGSLIWLAQWAATPEMVPLLDQSLEPGELAQVRAGLDAMDEPYKIEGSQVMVRATANLPAILASLQQIERLPADTAIGFAELVKEANPWISQQENSRRWTVALQSELARVLRQFNGVRQARVLLNLNAKPRGFARSQPESTAGVTLFMQGGEPVSRSLAQAAARMVAGAVRGLPVRNVQVIDGGNGRVALDWDDEEGGSASSLHQQRKQLEREKERQIKEQLSFDPSVLVSVSVDLDYSTMQVQDSTVSEGVTIKEESDDTSTVRNQRSGQPGVEPNVAVTAGSGSSADTSTTNRRESLSEPSRKQTTMQTPAGVPKSIRAAVSLSSSYLASVYQRNNPEAEPPTDDQIEQVFAKQKEQIARHVAKLVIPPDPEQVSVVWHHDTLAPETEVASSTLDASLGIAQRYGPAASLSLLALLALGMMMRMAKRADSGDTFGMEIGLPREAVAAAKQAAQDLQATAGQAGSGPAGHRGAASTHAAVADRARNAVPIPMGQGAEPLLEAQEVDETTAQIDQMLSQVSTITEQDSEGVAALVERWIDRTH
jgi:flagellar biosynthesis/type III secretory pathway M-ring protein FliF/YscJ